MATSRAPCTPACSLSGSAWPYPTSRSAPFRSIGLRRSPIRRNEPTDSTCGFDCSRHVRQLLQEYEMVGTEDCFLWVGLECSEFRFSELVEILIRCVDATNRAAMQQRCAAVVGLQQYSLNVVLS